MLYSSGWYALPEMSLAEAQQAKMRRLCGRLQLTSHDHLLEIGTGWGAMAEFAAREYGCRVTTTTISQEQYDYSCRRIAAAGLADRVTVLKQDYRQLNGQYDKLVSVEMIEAVGQQYIPLFFARCRDLLKPDGRLALQAITISEARFARYARSVDFIQRYIFPGVFCPQSVCWRQILPPAGLPCTTCLKLDRIMPVPCGHGGCAMKPPCHSYKTHISIRIFTGCGGFTSATARPVFLQELLAPSSLPLKKMRMPDVPLPVTGRQPADCWLRE